MDVWLVADLEAALGELLLEGVLDLEVAEAQLVVAQAGGGVGDDDLAPAAAVPDASPAGAPGRSAASSEPDC